MTTAMRQYNIAHIAQWRRYRASLEATERRHWASIHFDIINQMCLHRFLCFFHLQHVESGQKSKKMDPTKNGGMTNQLMGSNSVK